MQVNDGFAIKLRIPKEFVLNTHSHEVLSEFSKNHRDFYEVALKNAPLIVESEFGGLPTNHFRSAEDIQDFLRAFNQLLDRKKISRDHLHKLLYFATIFEEKAEEESLKNNAYNSSIELTRFLIDLLSIKLPLKEEEDRIIYHQDSNTNVLITDKMLSNLPDDVTIPVELLDAMEIPLLPAQESTPSVFLPVDTTITISSDLITNNYKRKEISGIDIPTRHTKAILNLIITYVVNELRLSNAPLYRLIEEGKITPDALKSLYNARRRVKPSWNDALVRVGILIADYLNENTSLRTPYKQTQFVSEYFSLIKAFALPVDKIISFPVSHSDLVKFYKMQGRDHQYTENLFKDSHIHWHRLGGNKL